MAKKYSFEVEADTGGAKKDLAGISGQLDDISGKAAGAGKEFADIGKMTPTLVKGFKGVGTAVKAAFAATGIGIIALVFDMFKNNQKVLDIFNTAVTAIQYVFNDLFKLVEPLTVAIGKLFTDPVQGIKDLGKMIKDYVINYFNQAWDIIKNIGGALANLVTGDWEGLKKNLKEIGTSVGDAILGSEGATEKMIDNVKVATKEAAKLVDLLNQVKLAEAELEKLREKGDLRLEKLRQIRDDEARSITERIAANEELGKALEEQIQAELKLAKLKTEAARQEWIKTGLIENQAEYIRAQANEIAIQNRLEGQRSEMLMNTNSLLREQKDIAKGVTETEMELQDLRDEQARLMKANTLEQLQFDLEALDKKKQATVEAIELELSQTAEGTARYQELLNEKAIIEETYNLNKLQKQQEVANEEKRIADETEAAKQAARLKTEEQDKQLAALKAERDKAVASAQLATVEAVLGAVGEIAGENAVIQKGIAIAEAVINTYKGATMALGSAPPPYSFIMMGAVIAAGIASVVKIARQKIPKAKGDSGSGGNISANGAASSGGGRQPGSFAMVQPLSAQLTNAMSAENKPQRAYVVSGDIESANELDRSIKANARG